MNQRPLRNPIALAIVLASAAAAPDLAAQTGGTRSAGLEEIVVTAQRREQNLQEVPIAVTAISGADLEAHGARDITELAQSIPSVTLEPTRATSSTLTAFIRGVGQQDPLAGFEQGVALYVDDVYMARPQGALLDIYDVERIEVLRGPQGTLYGRNAVGGAIKYVTRRLGEETDVRVKASYGSYDEADLVGTASTPLTDWLRVGGTIASLNRDGYGDNKATGDDQYDKDLFAYRLSAELLPTESLTIRLAYDHSNDDANPIGGYRPFPGTVSGRPVLGDLRDSEAGVAQSAASAGIDGNNEVEAEGGSGTIEWNINDNFTLRSITAYREDYTEGVIDFDSLAVMDVDGAVIYDNDQFSQEVQLLFNNDTLHVVLGAFYLDATASNDFDIVLGQLAGGAGVTSYTFGEVDTEAWSGFGDVTVDLLDNRLSLALGLRYTEDERSADIFRANYLGIGSPRFSGAARPLIGLLSDYEASQTFDDTSGRANIAWHFSDALTAYVGYSEGFKAGSYDPRGANLRTPEAAEGFEPEELDSWETGLKATWLDGRVRTNVALFYSDYTDMQIPGSLGIDSDGDGVNDTFVGAVTNAGESEIKGLEFEGSALITEGLTATAMFTKLDAEIKEWIVNGVDVSDQREIQNTPDTKGFLGLDYAFELFGGLMNLHGDWAYTSKSYQFEIPVDLIDQDSYSMYNASAVWTTADQHWSFGLHGKNLGDEDVKTAGYCFGGGGCPSTLGLENNTTIFYGAPRTWVGTVDYRFH